MKKTLCSILAVMTAIIFAGCKNDTKALARNLDSTISSLVYSVSNLDVVDDVTIQTVRDLTDNLNAKNTSTQVSFYIMDNNGKISAITASTSVGTCENGNCEDGICENGECKKPTETTSIANNNETITNKTDDNSTNSNDKYATGDVDAKVTPDNKTVVTDNRENNVTNNDECIDGNCEKTVCENGVCEKIECKDGACEKTVCKDGVCEKIVCEDGVCKKIICKDGVCHTEPYSSANTTDAQSNVCLRGDCSNGNCKTGTCNTGNCASSGSCTIIKCDENGCHEEKVKTNSQTDANLNALQKLKNVENTINAPSVVNGENIENAPLQSTSITGNLNNFDSEIASSQIYSSLESASARIQELINELVSVRASIMLYISDLYNGEITLSSADIKAINSYSNIIKESTAFLKSNRGTVSNHLTEATNFLNVSKNASLANSHIIRATETLNTRCAKLEAAIIATININNIIKANLNNKPATQNTNTDSALNGGVFQTGTGINQSSKANSVSAEGFLGNSCFVSGGSPNYAMNNPYNLGVNGQNYPYGYWNNQNVAANETNQGANGQAVNNGFNNAFGFGGGYNGAGFGGGYTGANFGGGYNGAGFGGMGGYGGFGGYPNGFGINSGYPLDNGNLGINSGYPLQNFGYGGYAGSNAMGGNIMQNNGAGYGYGGGMGYPFANFGYGGFMGGNMPFENEAEAEENVGIAGAEINPGNAALMPNVLTGLVSSDMQEHLSDIYAPKNQDNQTGAACKIEGRENDGKISAKKIAQKKSADQKSGKTIEKTNKPTAYQETTRRYVEQARNKANSTKTAPTNKDNSLNKTEENADRNLAVTPTSYINNCDNFKGLATAIKESNLTESETPLNPRETAIHTPY